MSVGLRSVRKEQGLLKMHVFFRIAAVFVLFCGLFSGPLHAFPSPSQNTDKEPTARSESQKAGLRLIGVINSGQRPMALLEVPGLEEQVLVGEGDLISTYTLKRVIPNRVDLLGDDEVKTLTVKNLRWIKADPNAKVYARNFEGNNQERIRAARELAAVDKKKANPAKQVPIRPDFIRPMPGRITSPFGRRQAFRTSTGMYSSFNHEGTDIAAPHGTRVKAAADGVVTASGYAPYRGRYVIIKHSGGYSTRYYHLYRRYAKRGQRVTAGQTIGLEGTTGNSTGPHLHFEIRKDGIPLDASRFIPSLKQ